MLVRVEPYIYNSGSDHTSVHEESQPEPPNVGPTPGPDEANDAGDVEEGEGPKILSKKEKERLKKEKEKVRYIRLRKAVASDCLYLSRQKRRLRRLRRRPNPPKRSQQRLQRRRGLRQNPLLPLQAKTRMKAKMVRLLVKATRKRRRKRRKRRRKMSPRPRLRRKRVELASVH